MSMHFLKLVFYSKVVAVAAGTAFDIGISEAHNWKPLILVIRMDLSDRNGLAFDKMMH